MKKRSHKKKEKRTPWSTTRRLLAYNPNRPSKMKATPRVLPKMLAEPPTKCDKCGNTYIDTFTEQESAFTIRMAKCIGALGGCGKTWRLI